MEVHYLSYAYIPLLLCSLPNSKLGIHSNYSLKVWIATFVTFWSLISTLGSFLEVV